MGMHREQAVTVDAAGAALEADLVRPGRAKGVIAFAHGSGSNRKSQRNRRVADKLVQEGFATLLLDLLTVSESEVDERTRELRFDIDLLGDRLIHAVDWLADQAGTAALPLGLFGASTGAAAALIAAAARPQRVHAVVSRGGRPDLAGTALSQVQAPVLLIVGGADPPVIDINERAVEQIRAQRRLEIVPGASHLFEEPGALEEVARLAGDWFAQHLGEP